MSEELKQKIADFLAARKHLNLATVTAEGKPQAHTVGYVNDGAAAFFVTNKNTRKAQNILGNPAVAFTVDDDEFNFAQVQAIQMEGTASLVADQAEAGKVLGMIIQKFPFLKDMPPNPDMVVIKIAPTVCLFIDNSKGYGHRDAVAF